MRRALALAAVTALWMLLCVPSAGAHALLKSSTPEDGALLDAPPFEVVVEFTEPPDLGVSQVRVLDPAGAELETGPLEPRSSDKEVAVSLPELDDGVYTVSWRVLSKVDGHVTAGSFSFGVGVDPATAPGASPRDGDGGYEAAAPSTLSVAGRWSFYWGLALLMGTAVAGLLVFRRPVGGRGLLVSAGWGLAFLGLVAMFAAERADVGVSVGALLSSDRGELLLQRAAGVAAAGAAAALALARPRMASFALLAAATGLAMLIHASAGHAGAASSWRWLKVGTQWLHILAVAVWIGGLVWLLLGLRGAESRDRGAAVRRFSIAAGYALAAVAATGLVRAVNEVGSVGELFGSGFGLSAVAKTVLFGGLVALGAYNRYRVVPALATAGRGAATLRRTVGGEVLLAAGVFGITGLMAGLVPPVQVHATEHVPPERVVATGSDFATTVRVRLAAAPGTPGPNAFEVTLRDFDSGAPVEARRVSLRFSLPDRPEVGRSELELERETEGTWVGRGTNLSVGGTWSIGVLIEQATDSLQVNLELETRETQPEVEVIEGGPGVPDIYQIRLEGGRSVQGYVDPGESGSNEIHFTFFDESGGELRIAEATITAAPPGEQEHGHDLTARRLGPGHFVASHELDPGTWRLTVEAVTRDGVPLSATFEEEIE